MRLMRLVKKMKARTVVDRYHITVTVVTVVTEQRGTPSFAIRSPDLEPRTRNDDAVQRQMDGL
jgi:hypothetical protein